MHTSVTPGAVTLRGYQGLMMTRGSSEDRNRQRWGGPHLVSLHGSELRTELSASTVAAPHPSNCGLESIRREDRRALEPTGV